jgi:hypothetical protein
MHRNIPYLANPPRQTCNISVNSVSKNGSKLRLDSRDAFIEGGAAMESTMNGVAQRRQGSLRIDELRDRFYDRRAGPIAAALLAVGLVFAIAMDGSLTVMWSRILFGSLFVLNIVMTDWLTSRRS